MSSVLRLDKYGHQYLVRLQYLGVLPGRPGLTVRQQQDPQLSLREPEVVDRCHETVQLVVEAHKRQESFQYDRHSLLSQSLNPEPQELSFRPLFYSRTIRSPNPP